MKLTLLSQDTDIACLACHGEIREVDVRARHLLEELLGPDCYRRKVLLDLTDVPYVDSSGIGWLVVSYRHFVKAGGQLIVHSARRPVYQTLQFLKLHSFLTIAEDEPTARALALGKTG